MGQLEEFLVLANYDKTTGTSRYVRLSDHAETHPRLQNGNGGSWCRRSGVGGRKIAVMYSNGGIDCRWDPDPEEQQEVEAAFREHCTPSKQGARKIEYVRSFGLVTADMARPIRSDIKRHYAIKPCSACGSTSDLVCDHKNDMYNNPRVLDAATQQLSDFQSLCNSCNLRKRQVARTTRAQGKRYGATRIPSMVPFGVDFVIGTEKLDLGDPNVMVGTYWYDPVKFNECIRLLLSGHVVTLQRQNSNS